LQCVAVCCSVLQCVAVCCSVLQCVAVCCSVLQCVAVVAGSPSGSIYFKYLLFHVWGGVKLQVSFSEYPLFYGALLRKRLIILHIGWLRLVGSLKL